MLAPLLNVHGAASSVVNGMVHFLAARTAVYEPSQLVSSSLKVLSDSLINMR